jgi:hypothetical protein
MQAEFGITSKGWIEVGGFTYTRHDVFEELDHPTFQRRLIYHKRLWNEKNLLRWLETNNVDLYTVRGDFASFWKDKEFDEFFSPYFTGPFQYTLRNLVAGHRLSEIGMLLGYEDFIQPEDREEAFRPLRIFLDENARLLRNINGENYKLMRPKIAMWIDQEWWTCLNALPHEFYETKTEIVTRLVNIGVEVQKSHRRDCRKVSYQLISLSDMPEHLRQTIVSNHEVYSSSGSSKWGGGFWWVWLIFILVRVVASNGCEDDNRNYKPLMERVPSFKFDSVTNEYLKKLRDSTSGKKAGGNKGDTLFLK